MNPLHRPRSRPARVPSPWILLLALAAFPWLGGDGGRALAEGGPGRGGASPAAWYSTTTLDDLYLGSPARGFAWRYDVLVDEDGSASIPEYACVRKEEFQDGLGRTSVELRAVKDHGQEYLGVVLAGSPRNEGAKWSCRSRPRPRGCERVLPLRFVRGGKVLRELPDEYRRPAAKSIADLADGNAGFLSASDILSDGRRLWVRKDAPTFRASFSDECGGAAGIRRAKGKLEVVTDGVTLGWVPDTPPPERLDPALLEAVDSVVDGSKRGDSLPDRLRREKYVLGVARGSAGSAGHRKGDRVFVSGGDIYAVELKGVVIRNIVPWASEAKEMFSDQFGGAIEVTFTGDPDSPYVYGKEPDPVWVLGVRAPIQYAEEGR